MCCLAPQGFVTIPPRCESFLPPNPNVQGSLLQRNTDSMGAMKYALQSGDMDRVLALMHEGFDVQTTDYDGRTILHMAAAAGDLRLVEVLVKQFDANVAVRDR